MKWFPTAVVVMAWAGFIATVAQVVYYGVKNWNKGRVIPVTGWLIFTAAVCLIGLALHLILGGA